MVRKIKAKLVLRLRAEGFTGRQIAAQGMSRTSVAAVIEAADREGIDWDEVAGMEESAVYARLFPGRGEHEVHAQPDWARVHRELARVGVTLKLLHGEYLDVCRAEGSTAMGYDRFCKTYQRHVLVAGAASRVGHKAGQTVEVDWSGKTMRLTDPVTGAQARVYLFVATLPFSRYAFVEPTVDMRQDTWLRAHVALFEWLNGSVPRIVSDNLKTGVIKHPAEGEVVLNDAYRELAGHYSAAVLPGRVKRPKDKASVENTVSSVATWVIASLRDRQFASLAERAAATAGLTRSTRNRSRNAKAQVECVRCGGTLLRPLPAVGFEISRWVYARKVQRNGHVVWEKTSPSPIGRSVVCGSPTRRSRCSRGSAADQSRGAGGCRQRVRTPRGSSRRAPLPAVGRAAGSGVGRPDRGEHHHSGQPDLRVGAGRRAGSRRRPGGVAADTPLLGGARRERVPDRFVPGEVAALRAPTTDPRNQTRPPGPGPDVDEQGATFAGPALGRIPVSRLDTETKRKLREMGASSLVDALDIQDDTLTLGMVFEERIKLAVDDAHAAFTHGKVEGLIRRAGLRYPNADLRRLDLLEQRGLDRGDRHLPVLDRQQNVVFRLHRLREVLPRISAGEAGLPAPLPSPSSAAPRGSWAAAATGPPGRRNGRKYAAFTLLVIDEWLLDSPDDSIRGMLLDLERRYDAASTVFCTQYAEEGLAPKTRLGCPRRRDHGRIVHNTIWIETGNTNMRETPPPGPDRRR